MTSAGEFAMIAGWREDLRRARLALEACELIGATLAQVLAPAKPAIPLSGLVEIDRTHSRPPAAIAAALIGFLSRGGHLEADLRAELAVLLTSGSPTAEGDLEA